MDFSDDDLLRYSRHILLDAIGIDGQQRLSAARVFVVGVGGLGSSVLLHLAAAGVGELFIADADYVELSNLQRQLVHREHRLGMAKVLSAQQELCLVNPQVKVHPIASHLFEPALSEWVARVALVIDCSDNFATRYALNRACVVQQKPLICGAAMAFQGQVTVVDARYGPCYQCLFGDTEVAEANRCVASGVFAPLVGVVGSLQAAEALKALTGCGNLLLGQLLHIDLLAHRWRQIPYYRDSACCVCAKQPCLHR